MDHTESSLMKLNKEDFVRLLLNYKGTVYSILDDLKNAFGKLKAKFTKLDADLNVSENVSSKLSDRLINVAQNILANTLG